MTATAKYDRGTGIQRVVRHTLAALSKADETITIQPVSFVRDKIMVVNWPRFAAPSEELIVAEGDIFLGLDLSIDAVRHNIRTLNSLRCLGVPCWFVVYDLLPLQYPSFFSAKLVVRFQRWFRAVSVVADGIFCISQVVADDVQRELQLMRGHPDTPVLLMPMGAELTAIPDRGKILSRLFSPDGNEAGHEVLMVGTLEPRKGHEFVLKAFDILWHKGVDLRLVIVGQPGWKTRKLQRSLVSHPQFGRRLFWFKDMDDSELAAAYDAAALVVAASVAEGFGLPVLEAIVRGRLVLARDIPVFREQCHPGVRYFPFDSTADALADAIVAGVREGAAERELPSNIPTWRESADAILDCLRRG